MLLEELFSLIGFKVEGLDKLKEAAKRFLGLKKEVAAISNPLKRVGNTSTVAAVGVSRLGAAARAGGRFVGSLLRVALRLALAFVSIKLAGLAAVPVLVMLGVQAAKLRREMALTAKEFGTNAQNTETLGNIFAGLGMGDEAGAQAKKSIEAMSEITKAIKKGGEEAEEAKKKLKGFGIDASLAIGADGTMRDSSALALDVIEAYKRVSAGAKALRDQQKNAPKGKQKALGAKALKEERRADQFAEDAGITGRLRVLIDEKSMPELRAMYEKIASLFPTMSSEQEQKRLQLAKEIEAAGLKADAVFKGIADRLVDLGVSLGQDVLPSINSFLDKTVSFAKAIGLIKETAKEKRDRESYEAASKRAEGMRAERFTTEDLEGQAAKSQQRFEDYYNKKSERMRKQLSGDTAASKMQQSAESKVDQRKYENIGNDQRTISPSITVNATGLDAVANSVKNAVLGAISTKGANTSTGALTAP